MSNHAAPTATVPVLRALLEEAHRHRWRSGVLGVRAQPRWDGPEQFEHDGVKVHVVPCESALAVWEALLRRAEDQWLIVLTDRDEDDLGAGIRSHFVWNRLRTPDPWDAVRVRFAATGIDPALATGADQREVAAALLVATPPEGWPPAVGGILTRDEAMADVAEVHLGIVGDGELVDLAAVLAWAASRDAPRRLADLRALAGAVLTDAVLHWAASRCGPASTLVDPLLRAGVVSDIVPLGIVAGLLVDAEVDTGDRQTARDALIRLETLYGLPHLTAEAVRPWAGQAALLTGAALDDSEGRADGERLLARADAILAQVGATPVAAHSDLLPVGLTGRLARLAEALDAATASAGTPSGEAVPPSDDPVIAASVLASVEQCWAAVREHRLARHDRRVKAFEASVRLARWLSTPSTAHASHELAPLLARHVAVDGWVDAAVNDAAAGVGDPTMAAAIASILQLATSRRGQHDQVFAVALARHTMDDPPPEITPPEGRRHRGVRHVEDILPDVVIPLARRTPVLLLVIDGMSAATASEVIDSIVAHVAEGWQEALLGSESMRAGALAVLPTLTRVSRTSLLSGQLRAGDQSVEQAGFLELARAAGLTGAVLFHKRWLEEAEPGYAIARDVAAAVDDTQGRPLVACVLNTVDDALDRSNPGEIDWTDETVKHLRPLLDVARHAGRLVVLTSDHGHIVERRRGSQRAYPGISSARSRPSDPPAQDGEVLVAGRRVLEHDGRAVLAVDERLRYGPVKAGYHGGATPAEAVVPLALLVPGAVPDRLENVQFAPPQQPAWWTTPVTIQSPPEPSDTLFPVEPQVPPGAELAARVVTSKVYRQQREVAARVTVTDHQLQALVAALLGAPDRRLPPERVAAALGVPLAGVRGAVSQSQRLLNVESYPVLHLDSDGETVVLDEALLLEQFEVSR